MNYYIADMHFGHSNVLRLDSRPFADVDEMNEQLIKNWNSVVTDNDTVYVIGDAFWKYEENSIAIMERLKGYKRLIKGNHDRVHGRLQKYWESIEDYAEIHDEGRLLILCHYPIPFYKNHHYGAIMLYGHLHATKEWEYLEKWQKELWENEIPGLMINVGCMMPHMYYTPQTLSDLLGENPEPAFMVKQRRKMLFDKTAEEEMWG